MRNRPGEYYSTPSTEEETSRFQQDVVEVGPKKRRAVGRKIESSRKPAIEITADQIAKEREELEQMRRTINLEGGSEVEVAKPTPVEEIKRPQPKVELKHRLRTEVVPPKRIESRPTNEREALELQGRQGTAISDFEALHSLARAETGTGKFKSIDEAEEVRLLADIIRGVSDRIEISTVIMQEGSNIVKPETKGLKGMRETGIQALAEKLLSEHDLRGQLETLLRLQPDAKVAVGKLESRIIGRLAERNEVAKQREAARDRAMREKAKLSASKPAPIKKSATKPTAATKPSTWSKFRSWFWGK